MLQGKFILVEAFSILAAGVAGAQAAGLGPEGTLLGQGLIATLMGVVIWLAKGILSDVKESMAAMRESMKAEMTEMKTEMRELRNSVDLNTKVTTFALLEIANLIPGARPMLEEIRDNVEERLKRKP